MKPKESREAFERRLLLYWETAQPLRRVFQDLPALEGSIPLRMTLACPVKDLAGRPNRLDLLRASFESEISMSFQNLSEEHFERLALRFRPFFAQNEETNFLRTVSSIAARNEELRRWHHSLKTRWHRAVFWGAMGLPQSSPPVTTDAIINAGFYSQYFHVSHDRRQDAKAYEESLGASVFRVALVSAVWQRSALALNLSDQIQYWLLEHGLLSDTQISAIANQPQQPERIALNLTGRIDDIELKPLPPRNACLPTS